MSRARTRTFAAALIVAALAAACGSEDGGGDGESATTESASVPSSEVLRRVSDEPVPDATAAATSTATTASTTTSSTSTTTTSTTSTTTSTISTTTTSTTVPAAPVEAGALDLNSDFVGLGLSVEGRPIFAERYGTPGGRRVLVIGVIHGNEDDGLMIVDELRRRPVPEGVELWLVESMNPDGVANQDRHNGNEVDLNRNFPYKWGPIGAPGDGQYAGPGPASEPETRAMVNFIEQLQPDIAVWYHQDLYVINPSSGRDGRIRARYAELTGLPMGQITGGTYTGIAATWARNELTPVDGVAFIVELGETTSPDEVATHTDAVLTIATEG